MATKAATKRLSKEYMLIQKSPPPFIIAKPLESNILEWHYVIRGPPQTPYEGGEYHGKLVFPSDYPFKPPSIRMTTPSGRFQTDTKICLSMSDFHPGTWNPSWSVSTIITGLLSFMTADESTTGSIKTSDSEKRVYAARSHAFNLNNKKFKDVFPELCTQELAPLPGIGGQTPPSHEAPAVANTALPNSAAVAREARSVVATTTSANPRGTAGDTLAQRYAPPSAPSTPMGGGAVEAAGKKANSLFSLEPWHKWAVFVAVCCYLLVSRLMEDRRLMVGVH